jgi:hypothetical protein
VEELTGEDLLLEMERINIDKESKASLGDFA